MRETSSFGKRPEEIKGPLVQHGPPDLAAPMTQLEYETTMCELICYPDVKLESKQGIDNAIANMNRNQRYDLFDLKCFPDAWKPESKAILAIVFNEIEKVRANATEATS
ncbi:hypothetical protein [Shouchella patagoniensis]|uniref:hypothetical protein n=1 Tax=Shouchella patagoniensis TaxID=228576 RepID=UPI000995DCB3|nr:hypothetical protein [Shouchella patagoniensis]